MAIKAHSDHAGHVTCLPLNPPPSSPWLRFFEATKMLLNPQNRSLKFSVGVRVRFICLCNRTCPLTKPEPNQRQRIYTHTCSSPEQGTWNVMTTALKMTSCLK